jgi:hypothetical protein
MPSGVHHHHKGGRPKDPAKPVKDRVALEPSEIKRMSKLLSQCVEAGLVFAEKVLSSTKKVYIVRFTRDGVKERLHADEYNPELKVELLKIVIGKVFAEKKDIGLEPTDPNALQVVGFNFTPIKSEEAGDAPAA